ncbi:hypothetical protein [Variovorax sp. HJSM1_2]|uniref:hypothetical protein n=1 Tax=Variovorax sp. HJSM1_2 TaxID=3366263 RepID=UPI003BEC1926
MIPTPSHSTPKPPKTSRWAVIATIAAAVLTTGCSFAYMWTQERPPGLSNTTASHAAAATPSH